MKRSAEYFRGCHYGYAAAQEMFVKYGAAFVISQSSDLVRTLRSSDESHTEFDYGYTHAYRAFAEANGGKS